MQNLRLQRPICKELRDLAPVKRDMQKQIDYPTELELPEKWSPNIRLSDQLVFHSRMKPFLSM